MQIILDKITPTKAKLTISGDLVELKKAYNQAVNKLGANFFLTKIYSNAYIVLS